MSIGVKAAIVATYFNIILGTFQVASIIELFFVLGQIHKAAKENLSEPRPPSLVGIATTYVMAFLISLCSFTALIYNMINFGSGK